MPDALALFEEDRTRWLQIWLAFMADPTVSPADKAEVAVSTLNAMVGIFALTVHDA